MTDRATAEATAFRERILSLRRDREVRKKQTGRRPRKQLSAFSRTRVLAKTAGQCHICGGKIDGPWQADHVLARSGGGLGDPENYLPSHSVGLPPGRVPAHPQARRVGAHSDRRRHQPWARDRPPVRVARSEAGRSPPAASEAAEGATKV
jgi:5-methylcytosine-specific restriction endonuclease McrA